VLTVECEGNQLDDALRRQQLLCPACGGRLQPWGYARRRIVRRHDREDELRPPRARCLECARTHVLLPSTVLLRRRDHVEVIGRAIEHRAAGLGYRSIAASAGVSAFTARRWLRRLADRADELHEQFEALAPSPSCPQAAVPPPADASRETAVLAAIQAAADVQGAAASRLWPFAAHATNGRLLSNTS
jgi:hypothetical protein